MGTQNHLKQSDLGKSLDPITVHRVRGSSQITQIASCHTSTDGEGGLRSGWGGGG
jgi:hypothetical protein